MWCLYATFIKTARMYCYEDLNFQEEKMISVINKKNPLIFYKNIKLDNSYNYKKYFSNKYNYKINVKKRINTMVEDTAGSSH
jgi:hypothetical protein